MTVCKSVDALLALFLQSALAILYGGQRPCFISRGMGGSEAPHGSIGAVTQLVHRTTQPHPPATPSLKWEKVSTIRARGMSGMFGLRNILHNKLRLLKCSRDAGCSQIDDVTIGDDR